MSGFYLLGIIVLWLLLTSFMWKAWRHWRYATKDARKARDGIALVIAVLWFGATLWYGGGRKIYYDWQVQQLCAVDGGINIYKTVSLPSDMFNRWGQISFFKPNKGEDALGADYVYKSETIYLVGGEYGQIAILRHHDLVYRRSDGKLLGEQIGYARRGGDFPGPWHPSSSACPDFHADSVLRQVFLKSEIKGDGR